MILIIKKINSLTIRQKFALAFFLGCLASLAMPPIFIWPIMLFIFPVLIWMLDDIHQQVKIDQGKIKTSKAWLSAGLVGWCFGFGFFITSLYWIGSSFLVEAEKFAYFMPFAVTLLPAGLAIFWAVAFSSASLFWSNSISRLLIFSLTMGSAEWLRGHLFTGFPWNLLGTSLTGNTAMMQAVAIFGVYGLTLIAILIFVSLTDFLNPKKNNQYSHIALPIISLFLIAVLYGYGKWRLANVGPTEFVENLQLHIIQPNVPQKEKVTPELRINALQKVISVTEDLKLELMKNTNATQHNLIIWPETAIPFALTNSSAFSQKLDQLLDKNTTLITGAFRVSNNSKDEKPSVYNSLFVIDHKGKITATYDKNHLVPFGEYLPLSPLLSRLGLTALVNLRGGFTKGDPRQPIQLNQAPSFLPYICYEAIFSTDQNKTSGWLLNISNDAWFGNTVGPYQHLHNVRLRAVERGLPMIRAVNGGISAIFDGVGRIIDKSKLNDTIYLSSALPKPIEPQFGKSFISFSTSLVTVLYVIFTVYICIKSVIIKNK